MTCLIVCQLLTELLYKITKNVFIFIQAQTYTPKFVITNFNSNTLKPIEEFLNAFIKMITFFKGGMWMTRKNRCQTDDQKP